MRSTIQLAKRKLLFLSSNGKADQDFDLAAATKLRNASRTEKNYFFAMLDTAETGLSATKGLQKQEKYGPNEVDHEKAPAWYIQFLQAFINPFIGVLFVIALISLITDVLLAAPANRDYKTVIVVAIMVLLSTPLRFWQS